MQDCISKIGGIVLVLALLPCISASAQQTRTVKKSYSFIEAQVSPGAANNQVFVKQPNRKPYAAPKKYSQAQVDSLVKIGELRRSEDGPLVGKRPVGSAVPKEEIDARVAVWESYKNSWLHQPVPDVTFKDQRGKSFRLPELQGKVVVVGFGYARCKPCAEDRVMLEEVARRFPSNPEVPEVLFLIPMVEKISSMPADTSSRLVLLPNSGQQARDVFNVTYWPTTFVIDKRGIVRNVVLGSHSDSVEKLTKYISSIVL